jgi:lactoylglutathione lyase
MRLGYIILYVEKVKATVTFYEKAFGLKCRFIHESGAYAEMETGQTALAFVDEKMIKTMHSFRPNRTTEEPSGVEISLVTDNVEMGFDKAVKAGAISVMKPAKKPWGQLVSYVKDNNGFLVEICSPLEAS